MNPVVMSLEESRRTQRPYRYGMILLCIGALINWLGLSDNDPSGEPIRYIGVACILGGALLICTAMCCWLHTPSRTSSEENEDPIHVITLSDENRREKPPDYDQVTSAPPSYDDAIKLDPSALLTISSSSTYSLITCSPTPESPASTATNTVNSANIINTSSSENTTRPSSSFYPNIIINKLRSTSNNTVQINTENEKLKVKKLPPPPPYSITPS